MSGLHSDDLDHNEQPYNPRINESIHDFLEAQGKEAKRRKEIPGAKFSCHRCGDCCRYYYFHLDPPRDLIQIIVGDGEATPHGAWVMVKEPGDKEEKIRLTMPVWNKKPVDGKIPMLDFKGNLEKDVIEFLKATRRRHGYWVLNKNDDIVVYSPSYCGQLVGKNRCKIYNNRPKVCRNYFCGRHPKGRGGN